LFFYVLICSCVSPDDLHTDQWPDAAETDSPLSGPALAADLQGDLSELRGLTMGLARKIAARADTEDGQEELVRLNAAIAKAARAVRQIAVLQLEIDGQRTLPCTRASAAANQNMRGQGGRRGPNDRTYGDYNDYDDLADGKAEEAQMIDAIEQVTAAMAEDFHAAGRPDACRQSPETQARSLIFGIPHPALDACIAKLEPKWVYLLFGDENVLPPALGPGPPDAWAEFDKYAEERKRGRGEASNS
jgi:hypothetical protein